MTESININPVRGLVLTHDLRQWMIWGALMVALSGPAWAGSSAQAEQKTGTDLSLIHKWWNGKGVTGYWLGARPVVADYGLTLDGRWRGKGQLLFGIAFGEYSERQQARAVRLKQPQPQNMSLLEAGYRIKLNG